jgi:hypothetical protein
MRYMYDCITCEYVQDDDGRVCCPSCNRCDFVNDINHCCGCSDAILHNAPTCDRCDTEFSYECAMCICYTTSHGVKCCPLCRICTYKDILHCCDCNISYDLTGVQDCSTCGRAFDPDAHTPAA